MIWSPSLCLLVFVGVVQGELAFSGFGHPAVITVAEVLMISRALQLGGVVDGFANMLARTRHTTSLQIAATNFVTALFSAYKNNIGAPFSVFDVAPVGFRRVAFITETPSAGFRAPGSILH